MGEVNSFYRIEYDGGVVQINQLISVEDYQRYKELSNIKSDLEVKMSGKKKKDKDPELVQQLREVSLSLKEFKPFFVVDSPLYKAINSGFIHIDEPSGNAGDYPVKITKIDKFEEIYEID